MINLETVTPNIMSDKSAWNPAEQKRLKRTNQSTTVCDWMGGFSYPYPCKCRFGVQNKLLPPPKKGTSLRHAATSGASLCTAVLRQKHRTVRSARKEEENLKSLLRKVVF